MNDTNIRTYMEKQPFFAGLPSESLDFLAGCAGLRKLEAGEILAVYGHTARNFYLLRSGSVSIEVAAIEGPPLQFQVLEPGQMLGWSWLIPPYRWHFQARATEPSEVIEFDGRSVFEHCEADPAFGYALLKRFSGLMSERLESARETMKEEWSPPGFA